MASMVSRKTPTRKSIFFRSGDGPTETLPIMSLSSKALREGGINEDVTPSIRFCSVKSSGFLLGKINSRVRVLARAVKQSQNILLGQQSEHSRTLRMFVTAHIPLMRLSRAHRNIVSTCRDSSARILPYR